MDRRTIEQFRHRWCRLRTVIRRRRWKLYRMEREFDAIGQLLRVYIRDGREVDDATDSECAYLTAQSVVVTDE